MIIGQGYVHMDPAKLSAIKDWQPPSSVKGVRSFLGFANFYRKFIPNFSNVVTPIVLLTRKDHPWSWAEPQQTAFDALKLIFSSSPVLCIPNITHPFTLMTDASPPAASAVLMQSDEAGDLHPCTYFSRPSPQPNATATYMIESSSPLSLPLLNGNSTYRGLLTLSPSSLIIKICLILKTLANSPDGRLAGLFFFRTLISFGRSPLELTWDLQMLSLGGITSTPLGTMQTLPSFLTPWSSTPLTSP